MTLAPKVDPNRFRDLATARKKIKVASHIGFVGYYAGPSVHIIDPYALGDPLLSKLPIHAGKWRVGHYRRYVPDGYADSITSGQNKIVDPDISKLYDVMKTITQENVWSRKRFLEIFRINTGQYSELMKASEATGKYHVDPPEPSPVKPNKPKAEPAAP